MIPTAVADTLEQIVNAIVSIAAGYGMMKAFASSPDGCIWSGRKYAWYCDGSTLRLFYSWDFCMRYIHRHLTD